MKASIASQYLYFVSLYVSSRSSFPSAKRLVNTHKESTIWIRFHVTFCQPLFCLLLGSVYFVRYLPRILES